MFFYGLLINRVYTLYHRVYDIDISRRNADAGDPQYQYLGSTVLENSKSFIITYF